MDLFKEINELRHIWPEPGGIKKYANCGDTKPTIPFAKLDMHVEDLCPHCKCEIVEKSLFFDKDVWIHRNCGKPIDISSTSFNDSQMYSAWLGDSLRKVEHARQEARQQTAVPTDEQLITEDYPKGRFTWQGMAIRIETPFGAKRRRKQGGFWPQIMQADYGYFEGTKQGADGDDLDVFVGPRLDSSRVFVVDQCNQECEFDEHKVMVGFGNVGEAITAYENSYDKNWTGMVTITEINLTFFKQWVKSRHVQSPLSPLFDGLAAARRQPVEKGHPDMLFTERGPIIALDLDGTMTSASSFTPEIGPPREDLLKIIPKLKRLKEIGCRILIHTVRGNDAQIREWLERYGIPYDFINKHNEQPPDSSDKPIATLYVDDRAISAKQPWEDIYTEIMMRLYEEYAEDDLDEDEFCDMCCEAIAGGETTLQITISQ